MTIKEQILQDLSSLNQAELEEIAKYLAFMKYRSKLEPTPATDEAQMAALYAEFSQEDQELAEEGMSDYVGALMKEDAE